MQRCRSRWLRDHLQVNTDGARQILASCHPWSNDTDRELGVRGDAAYLRIATQQAPSRWAVVWTPGDRWFSMEIDGGFSIDHFEEETTDEDAEGLIRQYVDFAETYVRDGAIDSRSRWLRVPRRLLLTGGAEVVLRRSLIGQLRSVLGGSATRTDLR